MIRAAIAAGLLASLVVQAATAADRGARLEIVPKVAADELTLDRNVALSPERLRDYCPTIALSTPGGGPRRRIALPDTSFLYDTSDCCPETEVTLGADLARGRFKLRGVGRDCFGGTAHFDVEEIYRLEKSGAATLIRRIDRSGERAPKPE